jgi:hypothetical protein
MGDFSLWSECTREEQNELETRLFELLFGADARPPKTYEECIDCPPRVFSYEDAISELAKVSRSLDLLFKIQEHYKCPDDEADDTEEAYNFRELLDQFRKEIEHGC